MKIAPTSGHSLFLVSRAASCKAFPKRNGTTASSLQAIFSNFSKIIVNVISRDPVSDLQGLSDQVSMRYIMFSRKPDYSYFFCRFKLQDNVRIQHVL